MDTQLTRIVQDDEKPLQVEWTAKGALSGTKVYYVSDSSGGAIDRKLTFVDGILVAET